MKSILVRLLVFVPSAIFAQDNWVMVTSASDQTTTVDLLKKNILDKGFKIFNVIEHAKEAETVGMTLRPTTLIIFGNPKAGTLVMQCDQRMGRVLPLKILVWEDEVKQVKAGFVDPEKYLKEYTLANCRDVIAKMKNVQVELLEVVEKR